MRPLPLEAWRDEEKWGEDNVPTWATEANYNQDGRIINLAIGEDRMKKHAIVF